MTWIWLQQSGAGDTFSLELIEHLYVIHSHSYRVITGHVDSLLRTLSPEEPTHPTEQEGGASDPTAIAMHARHPTMSVVVEEQGLGCMEAEAGPQGVLAL